MGIRFLAISWILFLKLLAFKGNTLTNVACLLTENIYWLTNIVYLHSTFRLWFTKVMYMLCHFMGQVTWELRMKFFYGDGEIGF